ncbi:MAG: TNT domain-containing protein [Coriobacteriales bacterium]|jgi:hypothetical protein|nr:TNT domain-containing protein [Coriobacteriales bacterium]
MVPDIASIIFGAKGINKLGEVSKAGELGEVGKIDDIADGAKFKAPDAGIYDVAKAANWKRPDGSTWYPPNDGFAGTSTKTTLQPGTKIDRYGDESGSFAAPQGTPYEQRSLPPGSEDNLYNTYEVVKPMDVYSGETASWFDQPGGGTQYKLSMSIEELKELGYIRPIKN